MGAGPVEQGRRSTRLSISIPVVISGMAADGHSFREAVRTLIVNKHGGKIATAQHLTLNSEITVENLALSVVAKANVVWLSDKHHVADLHHVGLQLVEAQNVWGIAFPPDDWSFEAPDEKPAEQHPRRLRTSEAEAPMRRSVRWPGKSSPFDYCRNYSSLRTTTPANSRRG